MKKTLRSLVILAIATSLFWSCSKTDFIFHHQEEKIYDKQTRADLAAEQNFEMTRDPKTNTIPRDRLWKAIEYLKQQERYQHKAAITPLEWIERGPNNVGGRTRAIMFDPNDPNNLRVFAASVSGGLWVTENIFANEPSWSPVDEFLDNMAITSLAYHPSAPDTMYFATGEGYYNADAVVGDGIFKSVDGGTSWTQLANTTSYSFIQKLIVDSAGNLYAATRDYGVVKSSDGGANWTAILNSSGTPSTDHVADLELARNGDLYAAFGIFSGDGIYKSSNGGSSWTKVYTSSGEYRIELACAPTNSDVVYMVSHSSSTNDANAVRRSDNGGGSWTSVSNPVDDVNSQNFCRGQAWYDISLVVDPNNETTVYMGGIDLYKSTNSGTSWTEVSHWYGGGGHPEVHADQHIAIFAPESSDTILFGNDGGIYLSENASSASPSFVHQVSSYNVTQFYGGAIHPTAGSPYLLAGAQDNGSHSFSNGGLNNTTEVTGGDGAFCHIDQNNPDYQFTQYVYNQFRRSTNGGSSFANVNFSTSAGKFINPTDYDNDAFIMYSSWANRTFMRWTNPRTGSTGSTVTFGTGTTGEPSAITCDPNTSNRIYIGTDDGEIWKIDNANGSITDTDITYTGMSGYVSSIDVELGDANHLLATFSSYGVTSVWESTNGGSSWTAVEGNLPDMPVRWGIFSPLGGDSAFLATELGVWTTDNLNGGSTTWGSSNSGLANVRTDMLQWRESDSTVVAFTHGRGAYSLNLSKIVSPDFICMNTIVYPCENVEFTDLSTGATSWKWDFNNDGIVDATTQHANWIYTEGGRKTVKLVINNSDSVIMTDYITVLPKLGTPYTAANGGNFETNTWHFVAVSGTGTNLWERGAPTNQLSTTNSGSNAWKTDLDADVPNQTITCYLYTPSFNLLNSGTYSLSFRKSMEQQFSNAPYTVIVEYSTNGGDNWNKLGTSPDANGTNWYGNTGIYTGIETDGIGFLENATNENTAYDISALAGNTDVRFRITYKSLAGFTSTGYKDGFMVDDFQISGPTNSPYYEVETELNASATAYLGPNDTINFISNNCKLIASVINLSSHDYGPTTVTVDNAGSGTMNFSTNTVNIHRIMEKTIFISPTTNNASGNVKITTYFTNTEASNWASTTAWNYIDLNQIKSSVAITSADSTNTIYGSSPSIDSQYLVNNVAISCTYSNGFSGLGAGKDGGSGPLPVELLELSGKRFSSYSMLYWTTASELNSAHFEIQRLDDGNFTSIGKIEAAGNSNAILNYSYADNNASANLRKMNYYRLKSIDRDGTYSFSAVIKLGANSFEGILEIQPNPADYIVTLSFDNQFKGVAGIEIIDLNGKTVLSRSDIANGQGLNISELAQGIYLLELKINGYRVDTQKLIISR